MAMWRNMQAVERVFLVLRALAANDGRGSVGHVAGTTGLPKSTTSRLLAALEAEGVVERVDDGYAIGLGLTSLGRQMDQTTMLRQITMPYLRDLVSEFDEGAGLSIAEGGQALYVAHVGSPGPVRTEDWTGQSFPFHTTAGGLAIMCTWSDRDVTAYAGAGLESFTAATLTTAKTLRGRITEVRRTGYAWTLGEFSAEINGVGAPILAPDGRAYGAVNVYGPAYRFPGERDPAQLGTAVIEVASQISARLFEG